MGFPDRIAPELLAHELLQQELPHRLQGGIGQHQVHPAAAILHVDVHACQHGGIGQAGDCSKARVDLQALEPERDRAERIEARRQVGQHHPDQALDQGALDGGVGPALDTHGGGSTPAAQQHVDDGVDHRRVDHHQAVVLPFLGLEHREHRRQGHGVEVVAEAERNHVVDRHLDVVVGEVAQGRRHDPDQPVEHDLEHRQALVGDQPGADDPLHAVAVDVLRTAVVEAEQAVDLGLVQDARGVRGHLRVRGTAALVLDGGCPGRRQVLIGRAAAHAAHCTRI